MGKNHASMVEMPRVISSSTSSSTRTVSSAVSMVTPFSTAQRRIAAPSCAWTLEWMERALAEPDQRTADAKENTMQKIAISSEGPTLDDLVDPRFGRAGGFVVVDLPDMSVSYIDNGASQTMSMGAGIETAERVANAGVQVVLSGYVGPKAFDALKAAGIKVCQDVSGTVREAVERFQKGEFPFADAPNK